MRPHSELRPALLIALLVLASKSIQLAIDSQVMLFTDSAMLLLNAVRWVFVPERSYVYGWLLRGCCVPAHSLDSLVFLQALMGALTAWLLAIALHYFLSIRWTIAGAAALVLAWDPTQIVFERMVMTETAVACVAALFLIVALRYLEQPRLALLFLLSFLAVGLTSLRVVYVPVVYCAGIALPLVAAGAWRRGWRQPLFALFMSLAAFGAGQTAYRYLTGRIAHREPAYHYATGRFLGGMYSPLIRVEDADNPRSAAAIRSAQSHFQPTPDSGTEYRNAQLWFPGGLVMELIRHFDGDVDRADREAGNIARNALRRDPAGFVALGLYTWWEYPRNIAWNFSATIRTEHGANPDEQPWTRDWVSITKLFPGYTLERNLQSTPTRRFHLLSQPWCLLAFLAPFLGFASVVAAPGGVRRPAAFLCLWSTVLLAVTCFGACSVLRYLHPLSFTATAALAILAEVVATCRRHNLG